MTKIEFLMIGGERFEMEWKHETAEPDPYLAGMARDRMFVRATRIQGILGIPDLDDYQVAAANIVAWRILP